MAERSAWICEHAAHSGQVERRFLFPAEKSPPKCSLGHTMVRQENKPYRQRRVPPRPAQTRR